MPEHATTPMSAPALLDRTDRTWSARGDGLWESADRVITTRELLEDAYGPTRPVAR